MKLKWTLSIFTFFIFSGAVLLALMNSPQTQSEIVSVPHWVSKDPYNQNIKPIFEAKCIACHACYNSPCQLNMTNYEGLMRGAHQKNPYDFPLTQARQPTRLGIDADSTEAWRKLGFYDIVGDERRSLLLTSLEVERDENFQNMHFEAEKSRSCLKPSFVPVITLTGAKQDLSMPYGLPKLSSQEVKTIKKWIKAGAPGPSQKVKAYEAETHQPFLREKIKVWEKLLNQQDPKAQLSARYFYEHLFIAHLYFSPDHREFFRLVRARNKSGPVQEIPTPRPYDPIEESFYYRFKLINQSLVAKNHTTFLLDEREKMRFESKFLKGDWEVQEDELPAYGAKGANPFLTFQKIPRKLRYQFFLENARYFVMTFMKGPVCRGQTSLNVINDHFWVFFLDPKFDLSANMDKEFNAFADLMTPPASREDQIGLFNELRKNRWNANSKKWELYKKQETTFSLDSLWDGDAQNPNSSLTIYRHFDSADVLFGRHGATPQTIWIMDYQIFEDIYYNLVAGYNLFGPILHQVNTRLYMELSRISSEDMFLTFLPESQRPKVREQWNQESPELSQGIAREFIKLIGTDAQTKMKRKFPFQSSNLKTNISYQTQDPKKELLSLIDKKLPQDDQLEYRFDREFFEKKRARPQPQTLFEELTKIKGPFYSDWPEVALVRIDDKSADNSQVFSLIANRAHYNVNMLFLEDKRRWEERDHIDVIKGHATSYPNFYFTLSTDEVDFFLKAAKMALKDSSGQAFKKLRKEFGVSRFDEDFWSQHAKFNQTFERERPVEYGALDLNRYLSL